MISDVTPPKIGFVSLGCPKALTDSEHILTALSAKGYQTVQQFEGADLVIINTCGFIDEAIKESLDTITEALQTNGKVIVTGCLGARKGQHETSWIQEQCPQVLAVTGPHATQEVLKVVQTHLPWQPTPTPSIDVDVDVDVDVVEKVPLNLPKGANHIDGVGIKLTPKHYAYLKISEGCNHRCTFCIIPSMRGDLVSRPLGDVLDEAQRLLEGGVRELLVVSQDTSAYGVDVRYQTVFWQGRPLKTKLFDLVRQLGELAKAYGAWVRLHYVYPYPHVDAILPLMAEGWCLPYLDIPMQHSHPDVLRRMQRPASGERHLERIQAWRKQVPDLVLRSTFIVGFPGETTEEFAHLMQFLTDAELDHVGCFAYSPVEGAAANALPHPVEPDQQIERQRLLMEHAGRISQQRRRRWLGAQVQVLVDHAPNLGRKGAKGRTWADAPEVDGVITILPPQTFGKTIKVGDLVKVNITQVKGHDLVGVLV